MPQMPPKTTQYIAIQTTAPTKKEAHKIAKPSYPRACVFADFFVAKQYIFICV